eukprot:6890843-Prymnesium_polylepis.2
MPPSRSVPRATCPPPSSRRCARLPSHHPRLPRAREICVVERCEKSARGHAARTVPRGGGLRRAWLCRAGCAARGCAARGVMGAFGVCRAGREDAQGAQGGPEAGGGGG